MVPQRSACICDALYKRPCTVLNPINFRPQLVGPANIVSFNPQALLYSPYYLSRLYVQQAFSNVEQIGHGSFGVVYAATSRADGRQYAIKESRNVYGSLDDRKRMLHEVQIHKSLPPHKNVVNFVMAWEECDRLYIQIELCRPQSLADMRQCATCVTESAVLKWTKDMASALVHLHKHDIIHLDVKPDNMFIGADGYCKLGDFGSARKLADDTEKEPKFYDGDGRYLAPELLKDPPTKAADVYSLGMSMLELASGVDFASPRFNCREDDRNAALAGMNDGLLKRLFQYMTNAAPKARPCASFVLDIIFWVEFIL
uniref:non-specific serine/threonine protein kinase n=1 Tax=Panagrellus redivivus TaxID=6233 RepID=A0A7E4ZY42_PANRE